MIKVITSKKANEAYSEFLVNISVAWLLSVFISHSLLESGWRIIGCIVTLYFAIILRRR